MCERGSNSAAVRGSILMLGSGPPSPVERQEKRKRIVYDGLPCTRSQKRAETHNCRLRVLRDLVDQCVRFISWEVPISTLRAVQHGSFRKPQRNERRGGSVVAKRGTRSNRHGATRRSSQWHSKASLPKMSVLAKTMCAILGKPGSLEHVNALMKMTPNMYKLCRHIVDR